MKNTTIKNFALLLTVIIAFSSCTSTKEGILNATMANPMGEMVIEGISIEANVLKADFEAEGNLIELEGTFEGDSYSGFLSRTAKRY